MSLRAKIILAVIISLIGLALIAVIVWGIGVLRGGQTSTTPSTSQGSITQETPNAQEQRAANVISGEGLITPSPTSGSVNAPPEQKRAAESEIQVLSMPFVERLGTYSNQSNYENLSQLLPFMTATMQGWANEKITAAQKQPFNTLYTGITTKALSFQVVSINETAGIAEAKIATQRKESVGTATNAKVYNQDISLKFKNIGGAWLVDSATWENVQ